MHQIYTMKTIQASVFIWYFKIVHQLAIIVCQLFSEYGIVFIVKPYPIIVTYMYKVTYVTVPRGNTIDFDRIVNENKNTWYYVLLFSKSELQCVNLKYIILVNV